MNWNERIQAVQRHLKNQKIDGWLLYDFHGQNPLAAHFLQMDAKRLVTRRFFYWIPAESEPVQLVHKIESHVLSHLPGRQVIYLKWEELEAALASLLHSSRVVAMEYSPRNAIPYLSKVDAGTVDLVRSMGVEVVSSGHFLQYFTCVLDDAQLASHHAACACLDATAAKTWEKIRTALAKGEKITEYEISEFIAQEYQAQGFISEAKPICAVNAHAADPHFEPSPKEKRPIQKGDLILIDLWCKGKDSSSIYGDITRMGIVGQAPTEEQQKVFDIVRHAQRSATEFVAKKWEGGEKIQGREVDRISRQVIEEAGYGDYFSHRTGHNIYIQDHGPGAHIDSLETDDQRHLIPRTCFSIEPGIYLPGKFGVRLEYDIYLRPDKTIEVNGGEQDQFERL